MSSNFSKKCLIHTHRQTIQIEEDSPSTKGSLENRGFSKETNLEDFVMLIEDVASFKFTLNERRAGLFQDTRTTHDPLDYLKELTQLIRSADWANLTPETAICHFFKKGVKCKDSQEICVKFLEEEGEDLNQLIVELKY